MKLSDRKKKILQIVVDEYITNAQPVSSKSITQNYMKDVSSATVRSELAALEEMGYLSQLHTSSGRVPSIEAYKLYVSELMDKGKLTGKELAQIKTAFARQSGNLEEVVKNAAKVISELTDYTSIAVAAHDGGDVIEKISIFPFKEDTALLLIVTDRALIRDKFIEIPADMTDEQLESANRLVNRMFKGKRLCEVMDASLEAESQFESYRAIFDCVIDAISDYVNNKSGNVVLEGEDKILNHPEYAEVDKMKNFLSVVTSRDKIANMLTSGENDIEINIKIGGESSDIPEDCSLVTATYSAGDVKLGTYGVIGPLRMDYQKVVSVLEGVGKILEDMVNKK